MSKYTINHSRCPDCGRPVKHYFWYCKCGNQELVNWSLTLKILIPFLIVAGIFMYFVLKNVCEQAMLSALPFCPIFN